MALITKLHHGGLIFKEFRMMISLFRRNGLVGPFPVCQPLDLADLQGIVHQLGGDEEAVNVVGSLESCYKTDFLVRHEAVLGLLRLWQKYLMKQPQGNDSIRNELNKEMERLERISNSLVQKFIEAAQAAQAQLNTSSQTVSVIGLTLASVNVQIRQNPAGFQVQFPFDVGVYVLIENIGNCQGNDPRVLRFKEFEDKENCSKRLATFLRFLERDNKEEINKYLANLHRGGIYPGLLNRALTRIIAKCDAAVADCNKFVDVINTINNGGDISNLPAPKF